MQYLQHVSSNDEVSKNYTKENYDELVINFSPLIVQHTIKFPKYEIFSAGSSMGGLLGIILGGSLMTLYEVMELVFGLIYLALLFLRVNIVKEKRTTYVANIAYEKETIDF